MKKKVHTIEELLDEYKRRVPKADFKKIREAYEYAKVRHASQKRLSGEAYIIHPLNVAYILVGLNLDEDTICAALLHDVIEDTNAKYEDIEEKFGKEVADVVDGVTKLSKMNYTTNEEAQVETYRKMYLAMAKDIRVIMVKLSDRLHNLRTLEYMTREKQILKAKETLDIYAPLANRLGMNYFKGELEDLSFKYLNPEEYYRVLVALDKRMANREIYLNNLKEEISELIKKNRIKVEISARTKKLYSIYKKMKRDNSTIDQIYDIFALRIIAPDIPSCYTILGILHDSYIPMLGRFKDYIAVPKSNMYQSIHTTLLKEGEPPFEIQIRTPQMHKIAEFGIAAHWAYKEANNKGKKTVVSVKDDKLAWIRESIEWQEQTSDPRQFLETLKTEFFADEVYVYTPKGEIKVLPVGATPIDFAYMIHEEVGNRMVGVKINSKISPIITKLKNGDIIEIITSDNSMGPSKDWLKQVKTPAAKARIQRFFKNLNKAENIEKGKEDIIKEIKKQGYKVQDVLNDEYLKEVNLKYKYPSAESIYASVGFGTLGVNKVVGKLISMYKIRNENKLIEDKINEIKLASSEQNNKNEQKKNVKEKNDQVGILVKGIENCLIKLPKCCNPLPGDEIIGYITKGNGISVHRKDCNNMSKLKENEFRTIDVYWNNDVQSIYQVELEIKSFDETNLLKNIINCTDKMDVKLNGLDISYTKDLKVYVRLKVVINDNEHLKKYINALYLIEPIYEIRRKKE